MTNVEYRWAPNPRLYRMTRRLLGGPVESYFRVAYEGIEHVPLAGAAILACNHLSNLDPLLLGAIIPRRINFLAKIELFKVPLFGRLIRQFGAIPLQRSASDPEAMRLVERVLEEGELLALFPEGTRSRDGNLKPFRFGAARLALKHDCPLIPAAIAGTDRAMPAGAKWPGRGPIRLRIGPPLDLTPLRYTRTGETPEAAMLERATALLRDAVARLKAENERDLGAAHDLQHS